MTDFLIFYFGCIFGYSMNMKPQENLRYSKSIVAIPALFVFTIWFVYWVEINFGFNFNKLGLYPRTLSGFKGVFTMHFIHSSINHLYSNSVPLFVLSAALFYFYKEVAFKVIVFGAFFTGILTWCIARDSYHIGASGVVYLLFSYVFFSGVIKKHFRLIATSLIVIFLYGSMIWYVLPIKDGMSWEGHLSGFLVGLLFAFLYKRKGLQRDEIAFSQTEFDLLFDEDGNFSPPTVDKKLIENNQIDEED